MANTDSQTIIQIDPVTHEREVITEYRGSRAGWWAAGVVAAVLVIAGAFVLTRDDRADSAAAIQAAAVQGRAQGVIEGAQAAIAGQTAGQSNAATAATTGAQTATAEASAADARLAASQAAASADQAAQNASAVVPDGHDNSAAAQ